MTAKPQLKNRCSHFISLIFTNCPENIAIKLMCTLLSDGHLHFSQDQQLCEENTVNIMHCTSTALQRLMPDHGIKIVPIKQFPDNYALFSQHQWYVNISSPQ